MLFDLWQATAARLRNRDALVDVLAGTHLTFADLVRLVNDAPRVARGEIVTASTSGGMAMFVAQVLRSWRDGGVFCPFETQAPDVSVLSDLPQGTAHVKLTSGTTGKARFVLFREEQLLADLRNISTTMGFDAGKPNLGVISAAHSYGFSHLVLPLLIDGMPLWHVPNPLPESIRMAFAEGGPFFLPAVPAMWRAWHLAGVLKNAPIARAMSAGAPLPLDLERKVFTGDGIKIHNFYGASECGGIAYDDTEEPRSDAALAGRALQGVKLSTDDEGCMVISSQAVAAGYWPRNEDSSFTHGSFTATDLAEITSHGVRLIGRKTDTINVAGRKVTPADVEHALLACPRVRHCVVFGVPSPDPARAEDIVACLSGDAGLREHDLAPFLKVALQAWQFPRRWWLTDHLKPDERGKISRAKWRAAYLCQESPLN